MFERGTSEQCGVQANGLYLDLVRDYAMYTNIKIHQAEHLNLTSNLNLNFVSLTEELVKQE